MTAEERKQKVHEYYLAHKGQKTEEQKAAKRAYQAEYRKKHREEAKAYSKQYYAAHRDEINRARRKRPLDAKDTQDTLYDIGTDADITDTDIRTGTDTGDDLS